MLTACTCCTTSRWLITSKLSVQIPVLLFAYEPDHTIFCACCVTHPTLPYPPQPNLTNLVLNLSQHTSTFVNHSVARICCYPHSKLSELQPETMSTCMMCACVLNPTECCGLWHAPEFYPSSNAALLDESCFFHATACWNPFPGDTSPACFQSLICCFSHFIVHMQVAVCLSPGVAWRGVLRMPQGMQA